VYRTEIKAKTSFSWIRYFKYANLKYRYSFTNLFQSFVFSHFSKWNIGTYFTFMCSLPNGKYNLSYSRTQHPRKRKIHTWFLCFVWYSFFAFWGGENHVFKFSPIRCRIHVSGVWRIVILYLTEIKVKISLRESDNSNMPIGNTVNHNKFMTIICIFSLFLLKFV